MFQYDQFTEKSRPFVEWMINWYNTLPEIPLSQVITQPNQTGIAAIDVIKGFTTVGRLSSPRIEKIVHPIAALFEASWQQGVRDIVLLEDHHPEDAVEFAQYGPHCITGSEEAETVEEFKNLPFFNEIRVIPKNSINPAASTSFDQWLAQRPGITTYIAVGDCSDICTYQLAMHLRISANAAQRKGVRVIAPVNTINTYDLPVNIAQQIGATPHDGDFLHLTFLYHMMLNGVEVVRCLDLQK